MERRGFLGLLAGAAFALDPERALWVPGAKTISIPAPPVFNSGVAIARYSAVGAAREYQAMYNRVLTFHAEALVSRYKSWLP